MASRAQSAMAGKQEVAVSGASAAGHIIFIVRKQSAETELSSPSYEIQGPALGLVPPDFRVGLPT